MDYEAEFIAAFRRYVTALGSDTDVPNDKYWEIVTKQYWETAEVVAKLKLSKQG